MSGSQQLSPWARAVASASLFALDPAGLGGVVVRAFPGPVRDRWLALLAAMLPAAPRRVPIHASEEQWQGGVDLPSTLAAGRPVMRPGLLDQARGGVLLLGMAERLTAAAAARIGAALDAGGGWTETGFGVVAFDEGIEEETAPAALRDRLALHIDLGQVALGEAEAVPLGQRALATARAALGRVHEDRASVEIVCATALALGVESLRAAVLCLRAARAAAALAGRVAIDDADLALAGALVLAPRATRLPASEPGDAEAEPPPNALPPEDGDGAGQKDGQAMPDSVLQAVRAAVPAGLLAALARDVAPGRGSKAHGRAGAPVRGKRHGRPIGSCRGEPPRDGRLHVLETLRAAAPWQRLRPAGPGAISVRREDFRVIRTRARAETTTIFVVDASGSAALQRLAEAKGAVETLLADCYTRRDKVAVVAFRGRDADLLLPPTRALARARRSLAGLPGGGGTPAAAGLAAALTLADAARRRGETPGVVVLTDGRANVALDGTPGRTRAAADADVAAARLRAAGIACLLVDIAPQPHEAAWRIADAMGARYLALPHADPAAVVRAARTIAG